MVAAPTRFYSLGGAPLPAEQPDSNLLSGWFVDLRMDEQVWNHAVSGRNCRRLLNEDVAAGFGRALEPAGSYLSDLLFTADGP